MPVEVACPSCEGKFRLPDAAAGKKIRCPKCKGPLDVPALAPSQPAAPIVSAPELPIPSPVAPPAFAEGLKSTWRSAPQDPAPVEVLKREAPRGETVRAETSRTTGPTTKKALPPPTDSSLDPPKKQVASTSPPAVISPPAPTNPAPIAKPKPPEIKPPAPAPAPPVEQWFLKGEDGETFGPVDRPTLDQWHREGRMTADSQVLKHGTEQWQWATDLYPDLEEPEPAPPEPQLPPAAESSIHGASGKAAREASSTSQKSKPKPTTSNADAATEDQPERLSPHSKPVAFLLALTLGMFGIHRFYLGYVGLGLAMFFTCGGLFIWSITDALRILFGHVTDSEGLKLRD